MPLILRAESLTIVKWWVDASYAAHPDTIGHTGATMYFGIGSVMGISNDPKIKVNSYNKLEMIGNDNVLPQILWNLYFIEAQGFTIDESGLFQDNLSTMLLDQNVMISSSKRTKHIRVR